MSRTSRALLLARSILVEERTAAAVVARTYLARPPAYLPTFPGVLGLEGRLSPLICVVFASSLHIQGRQGRQRRFPYPEKLALHCVG